MGIRKKFPLRQQCVELEKQGYPQDKMAYAWASHKFLPMSYKWIPLWHPTIHPNPFFSMGAKEPAEYEVIACPTVIEMTHILSKFNYDSKTRQAFLIEYSGIWWSCRYRDPIKFINPQIKGATIAIACADMLLFLLKKDLISKTKIRKLLDDIVSDDIGITKIKYYDMECPICRKVFQIKPQEVGPEPFLVKCSNCGIELNSDFIVRIYT